MNSTTSPIFSLLVAVAGLVTGVIAGLNARRKNQIDQSSNLMKDALGLVTTLQQEVARLRSENADVYREMAHLRAENDSQHGELARLHAENGLLLRQVADLTARMAQIERNQAQTSQARAADGPAK